MGGKYGRVSKWVKWKKSKSTDMGW